MTWVGYELLHRSYELGISVRRAEWFVRWSREVASTTFINVSNFEEGLGRIMYVLGALEFERPFLGPLYRFLTLQPRGSVRRVPSYVSFILRYLARQVERNRHYPCAVDQLPAEHSPRVDAQASRERTGIGGWLPVCDEFGRISTARSPWLAWRSRATCYHGYTQRETNGPSDCYVGGTSSSRLPSSVLR